MSGALPQDYRPSPEERARMYDQFVEEQYERVNYRPKPREFLPAIIYHFNKIWTDKEVGRAACRLFFWAVMVFMLISAIMMSYGEDLMAPRAAHLMHRISAGLFLLAVIGNFIIEFGWRKT